MVQTRHLQFQPLPFTSPVSYRETVIRSDYQCFSQVFFCSQMPLCLLSGLEERMRMKDRWACQLALLHPDKHLPAASAARHQSLELYHTTGLRMKPLEGNTKIISGFPKQSPFEVVENWKHLAIQRSFLQVACEIWLNMECI